MNKPIEYSISPGNGKYDDLCEQSAKQAGAHTCMLLIIGGSKGHGFSVRIREDIADKLPLILRKTADDIERELSGRDNR